LDLFAAVTATVTAVVAAGGPVRRDDAGTYGPHHDSALSLIKKAVARLDRLVCG